MHRKYIFGAFILLILAGCARITGSIEGGPEDEQAPQVLEGSSTPNFQTNFTGSGFELEFDEWIQLKNKGSILISPPPKKKPEIEVRGKKLTFTFNEEEVLADSTTYVINFSESLVDFTEGNPASDLRFVFSTGDEIDSLMIGGYVLDAFTQDSLEGISVMLYGALQDSSILDTTPDYFTRTKEDGSFVLPYLRADTFQLIALEDNLNYKYDHPSERIAFLDTTIIINDSTNYQFDLNLFRPFDGRILSHDLETKNLWKFTMPADPGILNFDTTIYNIIIQEFKNDTFYVWQEVKQQSLDSFIIIKDKYFQTLDTIKWKSGFKMDSLKTTWPEVQKFINHNPSDKLTVPFNLPIKNVNNEFITLADTSGTTLPMDEIIIEGTQVHINSNFPDTSIFNLELLPGAITDIYGKTNDTIKTEIRTKSKEEFGNLKIYFSNGKSNTAYILKLINSKEIIDTFKLITEGERQYMAMKPGLYQLEIIEDLNDNKVWDEGDWFLKRQPETIKKVEIEEIRANWDVELIVDWKSI